VWLLPSLIALGCAVAIRALRWRLMFAPERRPSTRPVLNALLIGYLFNNILPARAGEAARVVALKQSASTSRAETTGTVVLERAYDVLSLLLLLFVVAPWLPDVTWLRAAAWLGAILGLACAAAIVVLAAYRDRPLRWALRPLARMPFLSGERIDDAGSNLTHGLAGLTSLRVALVAFFWTTVSWVVMAASFWFLTLGFDLDVPPLAGLLVVIAINLAMILPSSPAAIGVFEAATIVALTAYGISESDALSYALVLHALNFVPYVVVGSLVLHRHAAAVRRRGGVVTLGGRREARPGIV
jgi:uncharacterized protein (TIRG00374 family)